MRHRILHSRFPRTPLVRETGGTTASEPELPHQRPFGTRPEEGTADPEVVDVAQRRVTNRLYEEEKVLTWTADCVAQALQTPPNRA